MDIHIDSRARESASATVKSEAKRRKLRKGTHSCWECKRRKVRCNPAAEGPCSSCRQRGTACINQDISEGEIIAEIKNPMVRVEALISQLAKKVGSGSENGPSSPKPGITTPEFHNIDLTFQRTPTDSGYGSIPDNETNEIAVGPTSLWTPAPQVYTPVKPTYPDTGKYAALSKTLYAAFPSPEDSQILCKSSNGVALSFYHVNTMPHSMLETEGATKRGEIDHPGLSPEPNMHPVILGRQMLIFATLIEQLDVRHIDGLSECPRAIMKRLADTAINLVCTNEELLGETEGIECIILEGVYQYGSGNLRRAWLAFRRALMVGQLMGIDRPHGSLLKNLDPRTKINPQFMWYRIVYMDRFLSMMLGLPQGTTDISMGSDSAMAGDTLMGKLERSHAVIAARILERKGRDLLPEDVAATREIDKELLKVAKSMPPKFWLPPEFSDLEKDTKQEFWDTLRLVNQLAHYNIINQLHLPYLLRSEPQASCSYSKMACVNASREILTRYITYASLSHFAKCCRFFAVPACMTLILAHLDSHHQQDNYLAHQRLSDRAMMEKVLDTMKRVNEANRCPSNEKGDNLLQCLLHIEAEAAGGQSYTARTVQGLEELEEDSNTVRIPIPYFGIIKITREGVISKEAPHPSLIPEQTEEGYDATCGTGSVHASNRILSLNQPSIGMLPLNQIDPNVGYLPQVLDQTPLRSIGQQQPAAELFPNGTNMFEGQNQYLFPGLTAGIEDWAFQGVDNAFFDSLMMGTNALDGSPDWLPDWQGQNTGGI